MNEQRKLVRTDRMTMRWGEMDALGHMNNVAYLRYFEEVRIAWFKSLELEYTVGSEGPILGTITCKYLKPAVYPVEFEITSYIGKPGKSSFFMWHELYNANDPTERFAEVEAKMVWIDIGAGRSRPMPDWLREKLQG
ncbi:MAG: acyl-CoA thioesterase [Betaproteobacteria bacterium]|nr:MAG: acyl-CoA thioesterase [Betaproteobacteria bacterium]